MPWVECVPNFSEGRDRAVVDAIAFNQAGPALRGIVRLTYRLEVNEYRGVETAQLVVEQIVSLAEYTV